MLKYLIAIFKVLPRLVRIYFSWILPYALFKDKIPYEKRFKKAQRDCRKILEAFNCLPFTQDFDSISNKSNKNRLIICNHLSFFDPLFIIARANRPVLFVAKKEARKFVFAGKALYDVDSLFLDRNDLKQQFKIMKEVENKLKDGKYDIVIFAEGTRNKKPNNGLLQYHHGTFRPAYKTDSDIIVCTISGSQNALSFKSKALKNPIEFKVIKIYKSEEYKNYSTTDFANLVHDESEKEYLKLNELNKKHYLELN